MNLQEELDDYRAQFVQRVPAERARLYDDKVEALRRSFPLAQALGVGQQAPAFRLNDATGATVSLQQRLAAGPVVVTFYRGGWCPYCNLQLRAYQQALPQIEAAGGRLIAISPQLPDGSLSTAQKNELSFDVLSDPGNAVARAYGLVYRLPADLQEALEGNGLSLPAHNGDSSWELPLTATFVVAADGRAALAYVDTDYRRRLEPARIVEALQALQTQGTQGTQEAAPAAAVTAGGEARA